MFIEHLMLWHFDPEHLSFAFLPVGQEFGDGIPVSRQQHPCACKRSSLCGPKT
jgi:hypothetical protein